MTNTISCRRGETLRFKMTLWEGTRDTSPRRNLVGATLRDASIGQSFPAPALAFLNRAQGEVEVVWTDEQTATMRPGRVHAFRLGIDAASGESDVIGDVWINML